jgi:hypothetical protein
MAQRLLALFCAFLLIAGSLGRAVQAVESAASHVVCPEHGELLHPAEGGTNETDELVLPSGQVHGDECALTSLGTTPAGVHLPPQSPQHPLATRLGHNGIAAAAVVARIPPLRVAPKASPPTV